MYIFKHIGHRFPVYHLLYIVAVFVHRDMYGIGVAKEVVHVAQDFLIGSHQEHTYIIMFVQLDGVEWDIIGLLASVDVCCDAAIAVAGDVLECGASCGLFGEA